MAQDVDVKELRENAANARHPRLVDRLGEVAGDHQRDVAVVDGDEIGLPLPARLQLGQDLLIGADVGGGELDAGVGQKRAGLERLVVALPADPVHLGRSARAGCGQPARGAAAAPIAPIEKLSPVPMVIGSSSPDVLSDRSGATLNRNRVRASDVLKKVCRQPAGRKAASPSRNSHHSPVMIGQVHVDLALQDVEHLVAGMLNRLTLLPGIEADEARGQHRGRGTDGDSHRPLGADDLMGMVVRADQGGAGRALASARQKAADQALLDMPDVAEPGLLDGIGLDRLFNPRRQAFEDPALLEAEIVAPMPGVGREVEQIALPQDMDLAGLGAVEGELALQAVIGLGAVVVGLEVGRVAEARTDVQRERHHVDLGRGAVDPVGDEARLLVAPQEPLGVAAADQGSAGRRRRRAGPAASVRWLRS